VGEALWGLAGSGVLFVVGSLLWVQLGRLWWAEQPDALHPELRLLRDQARDWQPRSLLHRPERRSLIWLGGAVLIFALLWATEFGLFFQLLYVGGLSAWWCVLSIDAQRSENRQMRERLGVDQGSVNGRRRRLYEVGFYVFGFMIAAGTLRTACFLGAAIAEGFA